MRGIQWIVLVFGLGMLGAAALGFAAGGLAMEARMGHAARVLGVFPVNLAHNLVHLLFGLGGLASARRWAAARGFARVSGALYLALVPVGLVSPTLGDLMPIGGTDVILHATIGACLTLVGLLAEEPRPGTAPSLAPEHARRGSRPAREEAAEGEAPALRR